MATKRAKIAQHRLQKASWNGTSSKNADSLSLYIYIYIHVCIYIYNDVVVKGLRAGSELGGPRAYAGAAEAARAFVSLR